MKALFLAIWNADAWLGAIAVGVIYFMLLYLTAVRSR